MGPARRAWVLRAARLLHGGLAVLHLLQQRLQERDLLQERRLQLTGRDRTVGRQGDLSILELLKELLVLGDEQLEFRLKKGLV